MRMKKNKRFDIVNVRKNTIETTSTKHCYWAQLENADSAIKYSIEWILPSFNILIAIPARNLHVFDAQMSIHCW